jgi:hypothetical protein
MALLESRLGQLRVNDPWLVKDDELVLEFPDIEMPSTRSYLSFLSMRLEQCLKPTSADRSYVLTLDTEKGQYTVVPADGTELDEHVVSCMPRGIVMGELAGANVVEVELEPAKARQDPE